MENAEFLDPEAVLLDWRIFVTPAMHSCTLQGLLLSLTSEHSSPSPGLPVAIQLPQLRKLIADLQEIRDQLERLQTAPPGSGPS